jgi:hypothetical protein
MTLRQNKLHRPALWALVLLVFGLAPVAIAQPADPGNRPDNTGPPQDVVNQLLDRGFRQVQPSIFERELDSQSFGYETVVYGVDGHVWLLAQEEAFLETLQARYDQFPAPELLDGILAQERRIADTRARIDEMLEAEAGNTSGASESEGLTSVRLGADGVMSITDAVSCTTTITRAADAGPGPTGPWGSASASFTDDCGVEGTVSTTAMAQGTTTTGNIITVTDDCPPKTGSSVSCSAYASAEAVTVCFSSGTADVTLGFFTYQANVVNNVCRTLKTTLTGTTSLSVPYGGTGTGSWSVAATEGTLPYTYHWFFNNAAVGTNSPSYSRSFPHPGYAGTVYYTVKVTVTDSSSPTQTVTKQLTVQVTYGSSGGGGGGGGCLIWTGGEGAAQVTQICQVPQT